MRVSSFSAAAGRHLWPSPALFPHQHTERRLSPEAAEYPAFIAAELGVPAQVVPLILAQYPLSNYPSPGVALGAIGTDAAFSCNTVAVQKMLSQYVPTWGYEFNDPNAPQRFLPPVSFPYGAYHTAELQFLFDLPVTIPAPPLTAAEEQLSSAMVSYWSRFAHHANPNSFVTPPSGSRRRSRRTASRRCLRRRRRRTRPPPSQPTTNARSGQRLRAPEIRDPFAPRVIPAIALDR